MKFLVPACLVSLAVLIPPDATGAEPWQGTLQDGSVVNVDPGTNRATVTNSRGVSTPIWNGVHRLEDGSTITTSNGIIVPNQQILESRQPMAPKPMTVSTEPSSECRMLHEAVCGADDACADMQACQLANQLLQFDQDEARDINSGRVIADRTVPSQCRQAFHDSVKFPPCKR
jgi:hypothetical protein